MYVDDTNTASAASRDILNSTKGYVVHDKVKLKIFWDEKMFSKSANDRAFELFQTFIPKICAFLHFFFIFSLFFHDQ